MMKDRTFYVYTGPYRLVPDTYKCWGYKYKPWDDSDRDAIKTMHEIETPDGKMIQGPWSSYKTPTVEEFHEFIDEVRLSILAENRKHYA